MPRGMALRKKLTKFTFCKALNFEQFALLKDSRNFNLLLCAKHSGSKKIKKPFKKLVLLLPGHRFHNNNQRG